MKVRAMKIVFCTGSLETIPSNPPKTNLTERFIRGDEIYKTCNVHIQLEELTAAFLMALDKKLM